MKTSEDKNKMAQEITKALSRVAEKESQFKANVIQAKIKYESNRNNANKPITSANN